MERGKTHFMALDGLRGVAALIIVVYHRRWWLMPGALEHGYLAVDFFLMLSGFVIGYAYEGRLRRGELSFRSFLRVRVERLGPLVALGAVLGVLMFAAKAWMQHWHDGVIRAFAALPLAMLSLPVPWMAKPFEINGPSWSLFFEIILNLAFAAIAIRLTDRRLIGLLALSVAALVALALSLHDISVGWEWSNLLPGIIRTTAPFFGGVLLYRLWAKHRLPAPPAPFWLLSVVLALTLIVPPLGPIANTAYVLVCVLLVFPALIALGSASRPAGPWKRIAALSAELSFPIYILHYPLLAAFDLVRGDYPAHASRSLAVEVIIVAIVTLAIGRWFDVPVRRRLAAMRAGPGARPPAQFAGGEPGGGPTNFQART